MSSQQPAGTARSGDTPGHMTRIDPGRFATITVGGLPRPFRTAHIEGSRLAVHVQDPSRWPTGPNVPANVAVLIFRTDVATFAGLEREVASWNGTPVILGELPTLVACGRPTQIDLLSGWYYDVFLIGRGDDGSGQTIGWARFATTPRSQGDIPDTVTLDEAKAIAFQHIGIPASDSYQMPTALAPKCRWTGNGRLAIVEFNPCPEIGSSLRIQVDELGRASIPVGWTAQRARAHIKGKPQ